MAVYPEKRKGKLTGVWIAEVTINGARAGRERFANHTDAQRWYDHMKLLGAPPPGGEKKKDLGPTVGQVCREHAREYEGRDANHARHMRYIEDRWGSATPIVTIDERSLDTLVNSLKDRPGYGGRKKLTSATINRYLSAASGLLAFAKRKKYIKDTPIVPWREEDGRRIHWLTVEEEAALGAAMLEQGWTDAEVTLRVLCRTGMRWGEFEGLLPHMVTDNWVKLDRTKTNTPRDIPVAPELACELRELVERGGIKYSTFCGMMTAALKSAGQSAGLTPHCLRHTAATRLVHAGFPLPNIKEFMGHKSITTTMKYVHVAPRHLEDAAKILSCTAGQSPKPSQNSADIIRLARR